MGRALEIVEQLTGLEVLREIGDFFDAFDTMFDGFQEHAEHCPRPALAVRSEVRLVDTRLTAIHHAELGLLRATSAPATPPAQPAPAERGPALKVHMADHHP